MKYGYEQECRWRVCARPAANVSRYVTATNVDIVARPRVSEHPVANAMGCFLCPPDDGVERGP